MNANLLLIGAVLAIAVLAPTVGATALPAAPATAMPSSDPAHVPMQCVGLPCEIFNQLFCPWLACVA